MFPNGKLASSMSPSKSDVDHFLATVRGVDLFPPPVSWMPPNCVLEVDDVLQEWTWREPFDLIHMRIMIGSFDPKEWDRVYQQCYE